MKVIEDISTLKKWEDRIEESDSYIPIRTTDIIEKLGYEVLTIYSFSKTYHGVTLYDDEINRILIENSYKKERAFRLSLYSNGMFIPLGLEKIIHRGERAKTFSEIDKVELSEAIKSRKNAIEKMKKVPVSELVEKEIMNVIFGKREIDLKEDENNLRRDNLADFIEDVLDIYSTGNYFIIKKDKIRKGRAKRNISYLLSLSTKLYKSIYKNYPFIFI